MTTYEHISKTAIAPSASWSNHDRVLFHYFNPNGVVAQQREFDEHIQKAEELGLVTNGFWLVYSFYGSEDSRIELQRLFNLKRVSTISYQVWLEIWKENIERGYKRLEEKGYRLHLECAAA